MDIDFPGNKDVQIGMVDYIVESIEVYDIKENKTAPTPARKDLFDVNEKS